MCHQTNLDVDDINLEIEARVVAATNNLARNVVQLADVVIS